MNRRAFLLGSTAAITAPLLPAIPAPVMSMGIDHASGADVTVLTEFRAARRIAFVDQDLPFDFLRSASGRMTFRTIQSAIEYATNNQVEAGTTIYLSAGTYLENIPFVRKGGEWVLKGDTNV